MKKFEIIAVIAVLASLFVLPGAILAYQYGPHASPGVQEVTLVMRAPENGNISPSVIRVKKGQLVRIRATSEDVAHGLFLSDFGIDAGVVEPGKWLTVEFTPDEVGEFSFTCNIRCSVDHNKVRGRIIVEE